MLESSAPSVTVQDGEIAKAWGYSITEWVALSDNARRNLRDKVVYAPNLATAGV